MKYLVDVETDHGVADDDQCYRDTDAQNGDEDVVEAGRSGGEEVKDTGVAPRVVYVLIPPASRC